MSNYVTSKEALEYFNISSYTLKLWKDKGIIESKQITQKRYLYDLDSPNAYKRKKRNRVTNNSDSDPLKTEFFEKFLELLNQYKNILDK